MQGLVCGVWPWLCVWLCVWLWMWLVHGAWCMVHGVWCMAYGVWCMCVWCMVHGAWRMVHGVWRMLDVSPRAAAEQGLRGVRAANHLFHRVGQVLHHAKLCTDMSRAQTKLMDDEINQ